MSHIVKATEIKLLVKFHDDWSKQSVLNATSIVLNPTSPNYANYEETHALICLSLLRLVTEPSHLVSNPSWKVNCMQCSAGRRGRQGISPENNDDG